MFDGLIHVLARTLHTHTVLVSTARVCTLNIALLRDKMAPNIVPDNCVDTTVQTDPDLSNKTLSSCQAGWFSNVHVNAFTNHQVPIRTRAEANISGAETFFVIQIFKIHSERYNREFIIVNMFHYSEYVSLY